MDHKTETIVIGKFMNTEKGNILYNRILKVV